MAGGFSGCSFIQKVDTFLGKNHIVPPAPTYQTHLYSGPHQQKLTYYLYPPRNYDSQRRYPLVLLLPGGGESSQAGNTPAQNKELLMKQHYVQVWGQGLKGQPDKSIQTYWPCFVVVPQVPYPASWMTISSHVGPHKLPAQPTPWEQMAKNIVDQLCHTYASINTKRLYITGISTGAYATWEMIEYWPHEFAAAAPVAGGGDPSLAARIAHLPIWAFQGAEDYVVPISASRSMITSITSAGGHPRYTEVPHQKHEIWDIVYAFPPSSTASNSLFPWLFSQST
jgi:predicted peptidase